MNKRAQFLQDRKETELDGFLHLNFAYELEIRNDNDNISHHENK